MARHRWATAEFASASASSGLAPGAPAGKRTRSADTAPRGQPRQYGTAHHASAVQPEGYCIWVGGFVRKLTSPVLLKASNDLIAKYCLPGTATKVIARTMATGLKIIHD